jgi:atypical dual specificity phosphatase
MVSSSAKKLLAMLVPVLSLSYLLLFPTLPATLALLPYLALTTKGVDLTVPSGLFLSAIWICYTLTLTLPLYWILDRFFILLVYLPINGVVFFKEAHDPATPLFLWLQTVFWDIPLLFWIQIMDKIGGRALQPFYSPITDNISVGSLPLASDVTFLSQKGTDFVVNLCREYPGPTEAYDRYGIRQIRIPTPDLCEPDYRAVLRTLLLLHREREKKRDLNVFVHCKAGRGRSAAFALCLLVSRGGTLEDAMRQLAQRRPVVEEGVARFRLVQRLLDDLRAHGNLSNLCKEVFGNELEVD